MDANAHTPTALIAGASRGLGLALTEALVERGWTVIGTARDLGRDPERPCGLQALRNRHPRHVTIEQLDLLDAAGPAALRDRLAGRGLDLLFVNAGTTSAQPDQPIGEVEASVFSHIMLTNALGPMRVIEALDGLVVPGGTIGVMSSGQGSVANNVSGRRELYRGSKAALNSFMRSYAARTASRGHPMVLMAPGWVRTELGGPDAPIALEDSIAGMIEVLSGLPGHPGLHYLDYLGRVVPW